MSDAIWWFSKKVPVLRSLSWPGRGMGQRGPM
jgi:hypothetical protein